MRLTRSAALLALVILAGGCAAASSGSPAASGSAPTATTAASTTSVSPAPATGEASAAPSPTATGTPRPWASDPLTTTARTAFVAAADRVNAAVDAAYRTYPIFNVHDVAAGRAFFQLASTAEREFVTAVKGIAFPAGMGADVKTLLDAEAALIDVEGRAAEAKTLEALDALLREYIAASKTAADASTVIRQDLGLPVGTS